MKAREWFLATFIILIGIICLTISGTHKLGSESIHSYVMTFVNLCMWIGLPLLIVGFIYLFLLIREKKKGTKS
ncbi:hypothetical protein ACJROX_15205 [Pseudalkalibacillus sp. A8]|uniref:hypothetical protein n=1 Tax=Pseudalkalibacillus sp. A8 TaxID=3382641 RepID=UPI0038B476D4